MKMNEINVNVSSVKFKANPKAVAKAGEYVLKDVPPYMGNVPSSVSRCALCSLGAAATGLGVTALQKGNEVEQTTTDNNASKVEEPKRESLVPLNKVHSIKDFKTTDPAAEALKNELLTYEENWQKEAGMTLYPNGMVENVTKDYCEDRNTKISYNIDFAENGYLKNSSFSQKDNFGGEKSFSINTDKDGRIVSYNKTAYGITSNFDVENKYTYNNDGTITSEFINNGRYNDETSMSIGVLRYPFDAGVNTFKVIDIDGEKYIKIKSEGNNGEIISYVQPLESYGKDGFTGVIGNKKMLTDIPDINYVETIESEEKLQTNFLEPAKQRSILTTVKDKLTGKMTYVYFNTQTDKMMKQVIMYNNGNSSHYIYDAKTGKKKVLYQMQEDKLTTVCRYDSDGENTQRINLTEDGEIASTTDFETYKDGSYKAITKLTNGEPYVGYYDKDGNRIEEPKE